MKIPAKPLQWLHRKRKQIRQRRERERGADIAKDYNNIDLAELEAQRIVEEETSREYSGHSTMNGATAVLAGGSSKQLPTDHGKKKRQPPKRSVSLGAPVDVRRQQFQRSNKAKAGLISGYNEDTDSFEFENNVSLSDLMGGTRSMQQKGQAGMTSFLDESQSDFDFDDSAVRRESAHSALSNRSHKNKRASLHLTTEAMENLPELMEIVKAERVKEWASRFRRSDPRHQIMTYFDDVATLGVNQITEQGVVDAAKISPILKMFYKSAVFTVWRPTSLDSIKKMMLGQGVGKGLDIKGKSAKKGKLSGFVPFLQLYEDKHKSQIRTLPKKSAMRIFFQTQELRDDAAERVADIGEEMLEGFEASQQVLADTEASDDDQERAMEKFMWEMDDPEIVILDDYADEKTPVYGIEIPERLFWEAFVMRQNVYREPGSEDDVGRISHPSFQDMNFASLRYPPRDGVPRAVVYQYNTKDCMNAKDIVVAYEENNRVLPVVSDFDCFLVGTRAVSYEEPIPEKQVKLVDWCCDNVEKILDGFNRPESWTERWLTVLKEDPVKPNMPPYGFGDPKSYSLMELAVSRLNKDGCVRHGAECFNYYFPQELDDHFLVVGEGMSDDKGPPWKYVNVAGLQEILMAKIKEGFTFPLNPKWVLCDPGWKAIYDEMHKSNASNVQQSLNCWYPPESGIREKIERISKKFPAGFVRLAPDAVEHNKDEGDEEDNDGTAAMDLAEQELRSYETLRRAKRKLRAVLIWMSFIMDRQQESAERKKLKEEAESPKKVVEIPTGEALRYTLQPLLRETMASSIKHRELKIRASLERADGAVPKLLDRMKRQKSFATRSVAKVPVQLLTMRSSLPAGTVAASIQGRFAGKTFHSALEPLGNQSIGSLPDEDAPLSGEASGRSLSRLDDSNSSAFGSFDDSFNSRGSKSAKRSPRRGRGDLGKASEPVKLTDLQRAVSGEDSDGSYST